MKFVSALLLTALFVLLLGAAYLVHVWYFVIPVVFYAALVDAALAAAATLLVVLLLGKRLPFTGFEKVLLTTVWLLGGFAFAITIPTVLDRSLSFYILEKLQQRGGGIREAELEHVFITEYIPEFRLMDVRVTEQVNSGTVTLEDGCVRLTPRGEMFASFSRFFRTNLLPKHRVLDGVTTDALVDPFKNSPPGPMGYEC